MKEVTRKGIWNLFVLVSTVSSSKRNNKNKAIIELIKKEKKVYYTICYIIYSN